MMVNELIARWEGVRTGLLAAIELLGYEGLNA